MYTPETRSSGFYRFTPSPFACLSAPCSTSISLISLAHAPPVSTNSSTFAHAAPQKPQTLHISTLCLSHLRLSWWPHIYSPASKSFSIVFVGGRRPRRPHSPMWHHKSSIRIKATHFLRFCRPPRPPSVRPPLYMPSTNCISPCMIRDDSDEKPNSDGSTLPPFLAPPFFFPAAWKPSSSCCFAPFLPPALFVQEGMGWGKRDGSDVCSGKRELQAAWVCKQGRRVMAVLGVRIQIRTSLCIMSASFSHFVLLVIAPPSKGQAPAPSPSQGSVCVQGEA